MNLMEISKAALNDSRCSAQGRLHSLELSENGKVPKAAIPRLEQQAGALSPAGIGGLYEAQVLLPREVALRAAKQPVLHAQILHPAIRLSQKGKVPVDGRQHGMDRHGAVTLRTELLLPAESRLLVRRPPSSQTRKRRTSRRYFSMAAFPRSSRTRYRRNTFSSSLMWAPPIFALPSPLRPARSPAGAA